MAWNVKRSKGRLGLSFGLVLFLWAVGLVGAFAQQYNVDWYTFDGGGGSSSGGIYQLDGTVGQPDAGAMRGGTYTLMGGFWSVLALPPIAPDLTVILTVTNTVMVYWPSSSAGFNLQANIDLATANWVTPAEAVQDNGTIKYIIVNPPTGKMYYRLKYP